MTHSQVPLVGDFNGDRRDDIIAFPRDRSSANLSFVVSLDKGLTPDQFSKFVEKFREAHEGSAAKDLRAVGDRVARPDGALDRRDFRFADERRAILYHQTRRLQVARRTS